MATERAVTVWMGAGSEPLASAEMRVDDERLRSEHLRSLPEETWGPWTHTFTFYPQDLAPAVPANVEITIVVRDVVASPTRTTPASDHLSGGVTVERFRVNVIPSARLGLGGDYPLELFGSEEAGARLTVNLGNGNAFMESSDYSGEDVAGVPHEARHRFNSLDPEPGTWSVGAVSNAPRLSPKSDGSVVAMTAPDGHSARFVRNSPGRYGGSAAAEGLLRHDPTAPSGREYQLEVFATGDVHLYSNSGTWSRTEFGDGGWIQLRATPGDDDTYLDDSAGRWMAVYRANGQVVGIRNWDGVVHDVTYHGVPGDSRRPIATFGASGSVPARYDYDTDRDNVTRVDDPSTAVLAITYDAQDRVTAVTEESGDTSATTRMGYHAGFTTVTPPSGPVRHHFFEPGTLGQLVTQTGSPPGLALADELAELRGGADRGEGPLMLEATVGDTSGVRWIDLYVDGVRTRATASCGSACPKMLQRDFTVPATDVEDPADWAEGAHTLRVVATGADGEQTTEGPWTVSIDRTAPSAPTNFRGFAPPGHPATLVWDDAADPPLGDGSPASGVVAYDWRYRSGGGAWSEWSTVSVRSDPAIPVAAGTMITLEVRSRDEAGNVTTTPRQETFVISDALPPGRLHTWYERCPTVAPTGVDGLGCYVTDDFATSALERDQVPTLTAEAEARPCSDDVDRKGPPPRQYIEPNTDDSIWKFRAQGVMLIPDVPTREDPDAVDIKNKWWMKATVNFNGTQPRVRMEWVTICGPSARSILSFETRTHPRQGLRQRRTDPTNDDWSGLRTRRVWKFNMRPLGGTSYRFRMRWKWRTIFATTNPAVWSPLVTTHKAECYTNPQIDERVCTFDPLFPGSNYG